MGAIAVVTDSAACLPAELKRELEIYEIPFELVWEGVVYRDGEYNLAEFYQRLRQPHTSHPTTSMPSLGAFASLYADLARRYAGIVSIHVSSEVTGTVKTARLAAELTPGVPIRVLDSRTATIAEGFVALEAARRAKRGGSLEEVAEAASRVIEKVDLIATLKTLEHIHRGGRLGEAAALLGSQLRIIPLLNLVNGRVAVVGLTRTWKHALSQIVDLTAERMRGKQRIHAAVFHGDAPAEAEWLRSQLYDRLSFVEFYLTEFTAVMGAHTGPDTVGVAFYADD